MRREKETRAETERRNDRKRDEGERREKQTITSHEKMERGIGWKRKRRKRMYKGTNGRSEDL